MTYDWNFGFLANSEYQALLFDGALMTIMLSLSAMALGTLLGVLLGGLAVVGLDSFAPLRPSLSAEKASDMLSRSLQLVRMTTLVLIDVIRAVPLLLLILFFYFAFPVLLPAFGRSSIFLPCLIALTINLGAFVGDLIRSATVALPNGMLTSARSLGFTAGQSWRHIVLPQIYRDILPSMVILYITIFKMSTLASTVSLYEILHSANAIIQNNYRPVEVYIIIGLFFIIALLPFEILARQLESSSVFRRRSL